MADMRAVFAFEVGKSGKIFAPDLFKNLAFVCRIDQRHTAPFEACAGKATAVNTVGMGHDLIKLYEFGRACLPVMYRRVSAFKGKLAEFFDIALSPCFGTRFHAMEFGIPMLGTLCPVFG